MKDNATGAAGTDFDQSVLTGGTLALGTQATLDLRFTGSASAPNAGSPFWQSPHTWTVIRLNGGSNPGPAGEDVGLADPLALVVATAAAEAFERIGLPEGACPLAEATLYLATAPKSNSAKAYFAALARVEQEGATQVPPHLQDASRDGAALGHGAGYRYPHDFPGHHVAQHYLPEALRGVRFYEPGREGYEAQVAERLERWRRAVAAADAGAPRPRRDGGGARGER